VRVGLATNAAHAGGPVGLHFAVDDLAAACDAIASGGGRVVAASIEVAPGVVVAEVADSEGNIFVLAKR
jgi:predicted enzyme related to lactoylglutathione lyase